MPGSPAPGAVQRALKADQALAAPGTAAEKRHASGGEAAA